MKLKRFFNAFRISAPLRRQRRIKWCVRFSVDDDKYIIALLPTIIFVPWSFRYLGDPIIQFCWLNFGISIGEWDVRK